MPSVFAKTLLESAIAVSDWLLSCQRIRRTDRYELIFNKLYKIFKHSQVDEEAYLLLVDFLSDVFDILTEAKVKGHIFIGTAAPGNAGGNANSNVKTEVERSYAEILREAEDFLSFLLIFAKKLDSDNPMEQEKHLCNVIRKLSDVESTEGSDAFVELRVKVMMSGFNFLAPDSVFRYATLIRLIDFSITHDCFDLLIPYIHMMESWMTQANANLLTSTQKRKLFSLIASQLRVRENKEADLLIFVRKVIKEFDAETDHKSVESGVDAAVEYLTLAIRSNDVVTYDDVMQSKTVSHLRKGPHHLLYQLGRLFCEGDQNDLQKFVQNYPNVFEQYGLDAAKCAEKIRLLVVASMASSLAPFSQTSKGRKLSMASVAERLQLSLEESESLVVRAISSGVLNGQIDQLNGQIVVCSSLQRSFGIPQWEELSERLNSLNSNISTILNHLNKYSTLVR